MSGRCLHEVEDDGSNREEEEGSSGSSTHITVGGAALRAGLVNLGSITRSTSIAGVGVSGGSGGIGPETLQSKLQF